MDGGWEKEGEKVDSSGMRGMGRGGWWKEVERVIRTLCKFPTLVIFNLF